MKNRFSVDANGSTNNKIIIPEEIIKILCDIPSTSQTLSEREFDRVIKIWTQKDNVEYLIMKYRTSCECNQIIKKLDISTINNVIFMDNSIVKRNAAYTSITIIAYR